MTYIESFVQQHILDLSGYWILVSLGLYFRYENLKYCCFSHAEKIRKIVVNIGVVLFLSLSINWMKINNNYATSFSSLVISVLVVYCFCILNGKSTNGTVNRFLPMINSLYVTNLSFTNWPISFLLAAIVVLISYLILRYSESEIASEFWEIVLLSGEAVIISAVICIFDLTLDYHTFLIVLFNESFFGMLNPCIIYGIKKIYDEDAMGYWQHIKGMDAI